MLVGIYVDQRGDSLRIRDDHYFKVEMVEPDSANLHQMKFTTGRWHKEGRKVYLTVAAKAMGDYWQCVPFKASWLHLKRPIVCGGEDGDQLNFKKVQIKRKRHDDSDGSKRKRKKKERETD